MRIGSRIKTWWQKKSTKYAAAGTLLLALAGAALALSVGNRARAASSISELNDADGQITTAAEFLLLRNASKDETNGNTYTLMQDIVINEIFSAATGTFAGTFNGNGHVITIKNIDITDTTDKTVSHGILFGVVAKGASVQDLIINITDEDASYTRNSTVGHSDEKDGEDSEIVSQDMPVTVPEGSFSNLDDDPVKKNLAKILDSSTSYYINEQGDIISSGSGAEYKREEVKEPMTKTVTYKLGTPGNDYLGVLCGTLSNQAEVTRVEVTGNNLTVYQNASEVPYQEIYSGTRKRYDYYAVTKGVSEPAERITEPIMGEVTVYSSSETTDGSGNNGVLSINVFAPRYIKQDISGTTQIKYAVKVNNISGNAVTGISLSTTVGNGNWSDSNLFDLDAGGEEEFTYTVTDTEASAHRGTFTVKYTGIVYEAPVGPGENAQSGDISITVGQGNLVEDNSSSGYSYPITVENRGDTEITGISLIESSGNNLTSTNSGINPSDFNLQAKQPVQFVCVINNTEYTPEFIIQYTDSVSKELETTPLVSEVIADKGSTTIDSGSVQDSDLEWKLTTNKSSYFEGETIVYSLTLTNTWTADGSSEQTDKEIQITSDTDALKIDGIGETKTISWNEFDGDLVLDADNKELVLQAEYKIEAFAEETVTINASHTITGNCTNVYGNTNLYTYMSYENMGLNLNNEENIHTKADYTDAAQDTGARKYSGNNLYTGVIAGVSSGSITEVKQDLSLNGEIGDASENGAELAVGGIMGQGQKGAEVSDLYILETPSASGGNGQSAAAGTVAALTDEGTEITLSDSLILATGSLGITSGENVYYNVDQGYVLAEGENANWSTFNRYTDNGAESEILDLSWLVVDTKFDAEFSTSEHVLTVEIPEGIQKGSADLDYTFAYEARKTMDESSDPKLYVESGATSDLKQSGYYTLLNVYATDQFYHYTQEIEKTETVYPYNEDSKDQNPYAEDKITWSVVRQDDGSDRIELTFENVVNGSIYYLNTDGVPTNGSDSATITGQTVQLPFDSETVQYWLTPMINGYIYPTISSDVYDASSREPLLKPEVTISSGYKADGTREEYQSLQDGVAYESGSDLQAAISGMDGYTLRYLFSESEPADSEWDMEDAEHGGKYSGRYTGGDISGLMEGSEEYSGSMTLPEYSDPATIYLYLQVSKENYNDTVYCYGPIQVRPRTQVSVQALLPETGVMLEEGATIVSGDVLSLESSRDGVTLQYEILTSQSDSHTWSNYSESSKPQLVTSGAGSMVYVYTRAQYSENSYSETTVHTFTVGDSCDGIRISPNTGSSTEPGSPPDTGGAYSIDAGEVVNLSSQTADARIVYLASGGTYAPFTIERVTDASLVGGMADGGVSGGYAYFQNGDRWYRVSSDEVTVYDETDGAVIRNEESDAQIVYVYAVNLAENMEPGTVTTYVYNVNPQQQVSAPEAALSTYYLPGGEDLERAEIEMGASLSFSSVTQGAELYYSIGNSTGVPETPYDPSTGIIVEGSYSETFTVRVIAVRDGMLDSEIRTFVYNIADKDAADAPTSIPTTSADAPTQVVPGEKILLSTLTRGASIYYTTDGTSPQLEELEDGSFRIVEGSSTKLYDATQGIVMPEGGSGYFTITAVAARTGLALSSEVHLTFAYPGDVMAPYASVSSGSVSDSTSVVLRNRTEDAVIYYTVAYGGEEPEDPTVSSAVFDESQPFVITQTTTIKAIAVKDGVISDVAEFTYTLMDALSPPTASIESGTVVSRGTVLHLDAASGATIYYTMDGSDPTDLSNTAVVQGDSLTLNGAAGEQITIMAVARQEGKSDSDVATFTYQFSANTGGVTADVPTGSSVSNGSKVNLMTDVTGATIYYTTDGSSPADGGIEGSTVTIQGTPGSTFTIKAAARVDGVSGTVVSFMYRIKEVPNAPAASPSGGTLTVATRVVLSSNGDQIYYTTDGTTPTESSSLYTEPILINRTTNLRAIAVSEDGEVSDVASFQYTAASKAAAPTASREDGAVLDPGTVVSLYTDTTDAVIYYSTDGTEPTLDNMENMLEYTEDGITVNRTVTIKAAAYREDLQLSDVSDFYYEVETIPAVEMKRAEEERLAEEGLHDTDASGLARRESTSDTVGMRQLEEKEYYTVASFSRDAAPDNVRLVTEVTDYSNAELDNVKLLYGDDYTILASYNIYLMSGSTTVRPDGDTEIGIPIPEGYENAAVIIASIDDSNKITPLETRREDGMVYAYMNDQSHYVLIGLEHPDGAGNEFNYLLILEAAAGLTAAAGIVYYISRKVKKHRKNR